MNIGKIGRIVAAGAILGCLSVSGASVAVADTGWVHSSYMHSNGSGRASDTVYRWQHKWAQSEVSIPASKRKASLTITVPANCTKTKVFVTNYVLQDKPNLYRDNMGVTVKSKILKTGFLHAEQSATFSFKNTGVTQYSVVVTKANTSLTSFPVMVVSHSYCY